jgi:hypothetical protein|nr:hypothetical protein [bacterium]
MAINILCDQCKRPMAVPNDINLKELENENGEILCPDCENDRDEEDFNNLGGILH